MPLHLTLKDSTQHTFVRDLVCIYLSFPFMRWAPKKCIFLHSKWNGIRMWNKRLIHLCITYLQFHSALKHMGANTAVLFTKAIVKLSFSCLFVLRQKTHWGQRMACLSAFFCFFCLCFALNTEFRGVFRKELQVTMWHWHFLAPTLTWY